MALDAINGTTHGSVSNPSMLNKVEYSPDTTLKLKEIPITTNTQANSDSGEVQVEKVPNDRQIKDAIEKINSKIKDHRTRCEFTYHEESNRISIKMIDEATDEVIKEIPPEDTIKMADRLWEMAGLLLDERR